LNTVNFQAYEGYEKLVCDPDVDIVYVGGINPLHFAVSKMALNAGKEGYSGFI
jgi:predicted dehydrogenase